MLLHVLLKAFKALKNTTKLFLTLFLTHPI